jgi:hypothetical protein
MGGQGVGDRCRVDCVCRRRYFRGNAVSSGVGLKAKANPIADQLKAVYCLHMYAVIGACLCLHLSWCLCQSACTTCKCLGMLTLLLLYVCVYHLSAPTGAWSRCWAPLVCLWP